MSRFVIGAAILLAVVSRFLTIYIRLRELLPSFVSGVPRKGSGGYTAPTADESALMAGAFSYMLEGTLDSTQRAALASKNYYVRTYRDRDSDQETNILMER